MLRCHYLFILKTEVRMRSRQQMENSLHQPIKFYSWLTGGVFNSNQITYFCFLSGFSITHNKGRKCISLYPFKSKEYSVVKKWLGLGRGKAIHRLLFVLANTLFAAMIFAFIKVSLLHFKKRKNLKVICENALLASFGKSLSNRHHMG